METSDKIHVIAIIGGPGSGKTSFGEWLQTSGYSSKHISTGSIYRDLCKSGVWSESKLTQNQSQVVHNILLKSILAAGAGVTVSIDGVMDLDSLQQSLHACQPEMACVSVVLMLKCPPTEMLRRMEARESRSTQEEKPTWDRVNSFLQKECFSKTKSPQSEFKPPEDATIVSIDASKPIESYLEQDGVFDAMKILPTVHNTRPTNLAPPSTDLVPPTPTSTPTPIPTPTSIDWITDLGRALQLPVSRDYEPHQFKVGVYFGSFDPIHENHVNVARHAVDSCGLDCVIFVPNPTNPSKPHLTDLSFREMVLRSRFEHEGKFVAYSHEHKPLDLDRNGRRCVFGRIQSVVHHLLQSSVSSNNNSSNTNNDHHKDDNDTKDDDDATAASSTAISLSTQDNPQSGACRCVELVQLVGGDKTNALMSTIFKPDPPQAFLGEYFYPLNDSAATPRDVQFVTVCEVYDVVPQLLLRPGVIFVDDGETADWLSHNMQNRDPESTILCIHEGMQPEDIASAIRVFRSTSTCVLITTDGFSHGVYGTYAIHFHDRHIATKHQAIHIRCCKHQQSDDTIYPQRRLHPKLRVRQHVTELVPLFEPGNPLAPRSLCGNETCAGKPHLIENNPTEPNNDGKVQQARASAILFFPRQQYTTSTIHAIINAKIIAEESSARIEVAVTYKDVFARCSSTQIREALYAYEDVVDGTLHPSVIASIGNHYQVSSAASPYASMFNPAGLYAVVLVGRHGEPRIQKLARFMGMVFVSVADETDRVVNNMQQEHVGGIEDLHARVEQQLFVRLETTLQRISKSTSKGGILIEQDFTPLYCQKLIDLLRTLKIDLVAVLHDHDTSPESPRCTCTSSTMTKSAPSARARAHHGTSTFATRPSGCCPKCGNFEVIEGKRTSSRYYYDTHITITLPQHRFPGPVVVSELSSVERKLKLRARRGVQHWFECFDCCMFADNGDKRRLPRWDRTHRASCSLSEASTISSIFHPNATTPLGLHQRYLINRLRFYHRRVKSVSQDATCMVWLSTGRYLTQNRLSLEMDGLRRYSLPDPQEARDGCRLTTMMDCRRGLVALFECALQRDYFFRRPYISPCTQCDTTLTSTLEARLFRALGPSVRRDVFAFTSSSASASDRLSSASNSYVGRYVSVSHKSQTLPQWIQGPKQQYVDIHYPKQQRNMMRCCLMAYAKQWFVRGECGLWFGPFESCGAKAIDGTVIEGYLDQYEGQCPNTVATTPFVLIQAEEVSVQFYCTDLLANSHVRTWHLRAVDRLQQLRTLVTNTPEHEQRDHQHVASINIQLLNDDDVNVDILCVPNIEYQFGASDLVFDIRTKAKSATQTHTRVPKAVVVPPQRKPLPPSTQERLLRHAARLFEFDELYKDILTAVDEGEVEKTVDDRTGLEIFNYIATSDGVCMTSHVADMCRGLVLYPQKKLVVATPFPRFASHCQRKFFTTVIDDVDVEEIDLDGISDECGICGCLTPERSKQVIEIFKMKLCTLRRMLLALRGMVDNNNIIIIAREREELQEALLILDFEEYVHQVTNWISSMTVDASSVIINFDEPNIDDCDQDSSCVIITLVLDRTPKPNTSTMIASCKHGCSACTQTSTTTTSSFLHMLQAHFHCDVNVENLPLNRLRDGVATWIATRDNIQATVKLDGSLVIAFMWQGKLEVTTRRRMTSEQAVWAKEWLLCNTKTSHFREGWTYLFEVISANNTVGVKYPCEGCVLLSAYTNKGFEVSRCHLEQESAALDVRVVPIFEGTMSGFDEFVAHCQSEKKNKQDTDDGELFNNCSFPTIEGFVLLRNDGTRTKTVLNSYVRGRKAAATCHPALAWRALCGGYTMLWLNGLPQELVNEGSAMLNAMVASLFRFAHNKPILPSTSDVDNTGNSPGLFVDNIGWVRSLCGTTTPEYCETLLGEVELWYSQFSDDIVKEGLLSVRPVSPFTSIATYTPSPHFQQVYAKGWGQFQYPSGFVFFDSLPLEILCHVISFLALDNNALSNASRVCVSWWAAVIWMKKQRPELWNKRITPDWRSDYGHDDYESDNDHEYSHGFAFHFNDSNDSDDDGDGYGSY